MGETESEKAIGYRDFLFEWERRLAARLQGLSWEVTRSAHHTPPLVPAQSTGKTTVRTRQETYLPGKKIPPERTFFQWLAPGCQSLLGNSHVT